MNRKHLNKLKMIFTVVSSAFIIGCCFEVFEEVRFQDRRTAEISGNNGKQTPASLTWIGTWWLVVGRLLHDLTECFISEWFVLVAVLNVKQNTFIEFIDRKLSTISSCSIVLTWFLDIQGQKIIWSPLYSGNIDQMNIGSIVPLKWCKHCQLLIDLWPWDSRPYTSLLQGSLPMRVYSNHWFQDGAERPGLAI